VKQKIVEMNSSEEPHQISQQEKIINSLKDKTVDNVKKLEETNNTADSL